MKCTYNFKKYSRFLKESNVRITDEQLRFLSIHSSSKDKKFCTYLFIPIQRFGAYAVQNKFLANALEVIVMFLKLISETLNCTLG